MPQRINSNTRQRVYKRDNLRCRYCGDDLRKAPDWALTIDHFWPHSRGGSSSLWNLVTCCRRCNKRKGNKTIYEAGMTLILLPDEKLEWYGHLRGGFEQLLPLPTNPKQEVHPFVVTNVLDVL